MTVLMQKILVFRLTTNIWLASCSYWTTNVNSAAANEVMASTWQKYRNGCKRQWKHQSAVNTEYSATGILKFILNKFKKKCFKSWWKKTGAHPPESGHSRFPLYYRGTQFLNTWRVFTCSFALCMHVSVQGGVGGVAEGGIEGAKG